jgi:hypothetical protein
MTATSNRCSPRGLRKTASKVPIFGSAILLVAANAFADDNADVQTVTPYRPTISNPADLPVPGWLEGEFGGLHTNAEDGSRDDSVPFLLKYAFNENSGLLLGGNAYVRNRLPGTAANSGVGDIAIEWKQRFPLNEQTALGFEFGPTLPTAKDALGVGKPAWTLNTILSTDLGATHLDLNAGATRFTLHVPQAASTQGMWAAAASWTLVDKLGGALEISGSHQRGVESQSQMLGALNYNANALLVLDGGVSYGLHRAGHDIGVFAGATMRLGRLH